MCAMRVAVMMAYRSLTIKNMAIDKWNGLTPSSQRSSYYQANPGHAVIPATGALVLQNYSVNGTVITRKDANWQARQLGRLNFSEDMWNYWAIRA